MNKWFQKGAATLLAVTLFVGQAATVSAAGAVKQEESLKIASLSDTHYLSPDMIKDTADFTEHLNSDRKMFAESDAFLTALLDAIKEDKPDVLLISGDLTKDGEKEAHEALAEKLEAFRDEEMPELNIYITPGNHDLNNANAMNFNTPDGVAVPAGRTSQADYKEIYGDLVYNDETVVATFTPAQGNQGGGLSYAARPKAGFTVISIDSARYSADNTTSGREEHETSGVIGADLEAWVLEQIAAAKKRGDTVVGLQHHGLVPHFTQEPTLLADYLVVDFERLGPAFADAGMQYVFTGHMHANDIASVPGTKEGNTLYDIETASVVTYPSPARMVTINRTIENETVTEEMDVETISGVGPVTFTNPQTGLEQTVEDISAYGQEHGFTDPMLSTTLNGFVAGFINDAAQVGSEKAILELVGSILGEGISLEGGVEELVDFGLPMLLPTDNSNGETIYYDSEEEGIMAQVKAGLINITVLIPNQGLKDTLNVLLEKIDREVLTNPNILSDLINAIVPKLTAITLTDDGKTLLDYANYIYQSHLSGADSGEPPAWVAEATETIKNGDALAKVLEVLIPELDGLLDIIFANITFDELVGSVAFDPTTGAYAMVPSNPERTPLISIKAGGATLGLGLMMLAGWKSDSSGETNLVVPPAGTINPERGYTVADFLTKMQPVIDAKKMLIEMIVGAPATEETEATEGLLTEELKGTLNGMLLGIVESMGTDVNFLEDNNASITNEWVLLTDRTALDEAVAEAEEINLALYTADSAKAVTDAIAAANALPLTATQEEMDQAVSDLEAAIAALKEPGDDTNPPDDTNPSDENKPSDVPQTGEAGAGMQLILLLVAGCLMMAAFGKNRILGRESK